MPDPTMRHGFDLSAVPRLADMDNVERRIDDAIQQLAGMPGTMGTVEHLAETLGRMSIAARLWRVWIEHWSAELACKIDEGCEDERIVDLLSEMCQAETTVKKLARERAWNPRRKLTWTRKKLERWQKAINALGQAWNASRK